jgi:hypothetical protein
MGMNNPGTWVCIIGKRTSSRHGSWCVLGTRIQFADRGIPIWADIDITNEYKSVLVV